MLRREFLRLAGVFTATANAPLVFTACTSSKSNDTNYSFAQGIASGDPSSSSVVLWTRLQPDGVRGENVFVTVEMGLDVDFTTLVVQREFEVGEASDYTLRVIVEGLQADTVYFYRFHVGNVVFSTVGRTLTAPDLADPAQINLAFVSCQERKHGFYGAYRQMINDDLNAPVEKQIRFVLHLGDFIYETLNDPLQEPLDQALNPLDNLIDRDGNPRTVAPFPQGGSTDEGLLYAQTLDDYRHLYRSYLSDPDLQAARARWPFIYIWDDHEFTDDCWQTEANYVDSGDDSSTDEPSQPRKVAANQAWFEYTPVNLISQAGVDPALQHSKEFTFVEVGTSPNSLINEDNIASNPDNLAAIDTLTIYRNLRYGKLLELILTDNRSYRSDHALPEEISGNLPIFLSPRVALPLALVNELDAGRTANDGDPDTFVFVGDIALNPRRNSPPGTMLGSRQKQWWKETLIRSEARWKIWCNSVPLLRMLVNLSALEVDFPDIVLSADTWDGYPSERRELMNYLIENDIRDVVSLSGDVHAHFAGTIADDHDIAPEDQSIAAIELVTTAISSVSQFAAVERMSRLDDPTETEALLRNLIVYVDPDGQSQERGGIVNNFNNTLLNGALSGLAAVETKSVDVINALKDPKVSKHLVYADTESHGYGLLSVTRERLEAHLITIKTVINDTGRRGPGIKRIASFTIPHRDSVLSPMIEGPVIVGEPPFPLPSNNSS